MKRNDPRHGTGWRRALPARAPIPKFASLCGTLVCELRNRRTLRRVLKIATVRQSLADVRFAPESGQI